MKCTCHYALNGNCAVHDAERGAYETMTKKYYVWRASSKEYCVVYNDASGPVRVSTWETKEAAEHEAARLNKRGV